MPLTREELAQIMGTVQAEVQTATTAARATDQAEITRLTTENETLRSQATAAQNRPALYGAEGQPIISGARMGKEEAREHVVQRIGNFVRALGASNGDFRMAAEIAEKRYGDRATGEALTRAMSEGVAGDGGNLVETQYAPDMINLLYAQAVVRRAGARVVPLPNGNMTLHRQASGVTGAYSGELANLATQQPTTDAVTLLAKKLAVIVPVSNELLHDTSGRVNDLIVSDIGQGLSLRSDLAFLRGDGSSNTPVGVLNQVAAQNVKTYTTLAALLSGMRAQIRAANTPMLRMGWIMNSDAESLFYNLLSTTGNYVYRDEMDAGKLLGFPLYLSNQIPSNLTGIGAAGNTNTTGTEVYFGDWSESMIGEALALQIETSREGSYWNGSSIVSAFGTDQTLFRAITRHDFGVRHNRSLAVGKIDISTVTPR